MNNFSQWFNVLRVGKNYNTMQYFNGTGGDTFEINFAGGYLDKSHVKAVADDGGQEITLTFVTASRVKASRIIPVGVNILIFRDTPKVVPLALFSDGSVVNSINLDRNAKQAVFVAAEMLDRFDTFGSSLETSVSQVSEALAIATEAKAIAESAKSISDGMDSQVKDAVNKVNALDSAIKGFTGTLQPDASGEVVKAHTDKSLDVQIQALVNRWDSLQGTSSGGGSDKVGFVDPIAPAYLKTLSDITNMEAVNFLRFVPREHHSGILNGVSTFDCREMFQEFVRAVRVGSLPRAGLIRLSNAIKIEEAFRLFGNGATLIGNEGGQAGGSVLDVLASGLDIRDLSIHSYSPAKRARAIAITARNTDIEGFKIDNLNTRDCFYAIRASSEDKVHRVKGIDISRVRSVAPLGSVPSGHFMMQYVDDVTITASHTRGGFNTSSFGFSKGTKGIVVSACTERGLIHSSSYVEGSLQIEESQDSAASITGNSFSSDIWISDSSDVVASGNRCGRLRVTVGHRGDNLGASGVLFKANNAAGIHCTSYGVDPEMERIYARFEGNNLDPRRQNPTMPASARLIALQGSHIGKVELHRNKVEHDASTNSLTITRAPGCVVVATSNDFGSKPHLLSGSGAAIYEHSNINPISKAGYIKVALNADLPAPVNDEWTRVVFTRTVVNINAEFSAGVFTPLRSGWYLFNGCLTFKGVITNAQLGARLVTTSALGVQTEVARLGLRKVVGGSLESFPFRSVKLYVEEGSSLEVQYWVSGSSAASLSLGDAVTEFEVECAL